MTFERDLKDKVNSLVKSESASGRPIELQYQEDGAVVVKESRRILDFYDTLQEACEEFGPDSGFGVPVQIRAQSLIK